MFPVREKERLYAAYHDFGYFAALATKGPPPTSFLEREFEEGSCDNVLDFFTMLGKAKVGGCCSLT
jgi:hypothetical protein